MSLPPDRSNRSASEIEIKAESLQRVDERMWAPEDNNEKLKLLFSYIDVNKNGAISKVHFQKFKN